MQVTRQVAQGIADAALIVGVELGGGVGHALILPAAVAQGGTLRGPWTIGYGHTGADVRPGLRISQARAEAWLLADVAHAEASVDRLLQGVALSLRQRDALVSFCFNVGAGALEGSTLRRGLLAGEPATQVIAEELPRWCKGPCGPIVGLQRRRAAEIAHAAKTD